MKIKRTSPSIFILLLMCASARAFGQDGSNEMVIFGDSLSDVGNAYAEHATLILPEPPLYTLGCFTDGTDTIPRTTRTGIWVEQLAGDLGFPAPLPSSSGGSDYAVGGATTGTGTFNLDEQVRSFLTASPAAPSGALYVVWAGANDLLNATELGAAATPAHAESAAISDLTSNIGQLAQAGAKRIIWVNLPALDKTPYGSSLTPGLQSALHAASVQFNTDSASAATTLESEYPGLQILSVDTYTLFNNILASPSTYGFTNTTLFAMSNPLVDSDHYLFWDPIHPTTVGHGLITSAAYAVIENAPPLKDLFNGVTLGGGWYWSGVIGYYAGTPPGWIYHQQLGWLYIDPSDTTGSIWIWMPGMGWLWTNLSTYPNLFRASDNAWLWYDEGTTGPSWYYNLTAGKWESH